MRRSERRRRVRHRRIPYVWMLLLVGCGGIQGSSTGDAGRGQDATIAESSATADASPGDAIGDGREPDQVVNDAAPDSPMDAGAAGCPASFPNGACTVNGLLCTYPGGPCTCSRDCPPGACCPLTCEQLGFPCGVVGDGCGGTLTCRSCPAGQTCQGGGCAPTDAGCTLATCPDAACGLLGDGCGGQIQCGLCFWRCVLAGP